MMHVAPVDWSASTRDKVYEKMISQVEQAKARGGMVIVVAHDKPRPAIQREPGPSARLIRLSRPRP